MKEKINQLVELLGQSEKSEPIIQMCQDLNITQPLPRADFSGNVDFDKIIPDLEFQFTTVEELPEYNDNPKYMKGELILANIFVWENKELKNKTLPLGFVFGMSKDDVVKMYAEPEWKRAIDNTYRWSINDLKVSLTFDDDNQNLDAIVYFLPNRFT